MSDMIITLTLNAAGLKKGVDEAQAKLKGIPDKKTTKLDGDAKGLATSISNAQKQILKLAAGAFAVTQVWQTVTDVIGKSIQEARDAEIAQRLLKSQLEATGNAAGLSAEELTKISQELQRMSNMGDDAIIQNLTVPLTTFRNVSGEVFERTQKAILDLNAVLGDPNNPSSLRSSAVQVGKALNDPLQGLTALRRVGISFSQSQIDTIKNLAETNRLAEAQGLILDELENEFGGAAASTVNSSIQMREAWKNLLETWGKSTIPVLDAMNLAFTNFFMVQTENLGTFADAQGESQQLMFRGWNDFSTSFVMNANAVGTFIIHWGATVAGSLDSVFKITRDGLIAFGKSVWDVVNKLPSAALRAFGADMSGLQDIGESVSENFGKVGNDVSGYTERLDYHLKTAISGFKNYEKEFGQITGRSAASYQKLTELQSKLKANLEELGGESGNAGVGGSESNGEVVAAGAKYGKLLEVMTNYHREAEQASLSHYDKELDTLQRKMTEEEAMIQEAADQKLIGQEEADEMKLELERIYADKFSEVLNQEIADRDAEQQKADAANLKAQAEALEAKLRDQAGYYEAMKFIDAGYYEWQKQQIVQQVAGMGLEAAQAQALTQKLMADLEAEKTAFAEAQNATGGGGGNSKSWFFSDVLGYDPNNPADQERVDAIKSTYSTISQGAQSMVSRLISLTRQRKEEELNTIEGTAAREKWSQDRLLAEKTKINARYAAEERKLRNAQKTLSIATAIINVAEGVTKALAMGPIIGPIMAAIISAMGAVQIGIIRAQKFAQGGLFRGKGGPRDDQNIVAVSDGEYIVNAAATKRNKSLLDAINYGFMNAPVIPRFAYAGGGQVSSYGIAPVIQHIAKSVDALGDKIEILNLNLVKKQVSVTVQNRIDGDSVVRTTDISRNRMERRGYVPDIS